MVLISEKTPEEYNPKIYYVGIFDYEKLMKTMYRWMTEQGFEFHEDVYKHKVPTALGAEQEFKLSGWKKVTEYVRFWIYVNGHIWDLKEIEVEIDGERKTLARGRIQLIFSNSTELDYNEKFKGPFAEKLQTFLNNFIWKKQITGGWQDEIYYRMYKLHREVKEVLNMSSPSNAASIRC